jgi:hypothetical protein
VSKRNFIHSRFNIVNILYFLLKEEEVYWIPRMIHVASFMRIVLCAQWQETKCRNANIEREIRMSVCCNCLRLNTQSVEGLTKNHMLQKFRSCVRGPPEIRNLRSDVSRNNWDLPQKTELIKIHERIVQGCQYTCGMNYTLYQVLYSSRLWHLQYMGPVTFVKKSKMNH